MAALAKDSSYESSMNELNFLLSHLVKHQSTLKLCKTVLSHIVRDPTNPKYQSLNDAKLSNKCNADEYVYLSRFLKVIGFQRNMIKKSTTNTLDYDASAECRWIFNPHMHNINVLKRFLNVIETQFTAIKKQISAKQIAVAYPPKMGELATENVSFWAKCQHSMDNFHSGSSWGNYFVVLIFVNLLPHQISIHWINRSGIERERGTIVEVGKDVTIFAQLNHPHVVKMPANKLYGMTDEYLIGYNATARGISNNGYHIIFIGGKMSGSMVQKKALNLIANASEDKRVKPRMGPAPDPPKPEDRRGKFWGGR